ncbi:hypothetical protein BC835DRAFT_1510885 [Cytidiella melzeri]|nr:hypothetical protein BC835DRAFT_1510885 [Cytidiella melzeri]
MADIPQDHTYFERERDRLIVEVAAAFEKLLPRSNNMNRKLEEVLEATREYETIAALWHSFHELMKSQRDDDEGVEGQAHGLPGTGGHVLKQQSFSQ